MDVDDIKGGDNFTTVIERNLDVSDALVAVIGSALVDGHRAEWRTTAR